MPRQNRRRKVIAVEEDRRLMPIKEEENAEAPQSLIDKVLEDPAPAEPAITEPPVEEALPPSSPVPPELNYEALLSVPGITGQIAKAVVEAQPHSQVELEVLIREFEPDPKKNQQLAKKIAERFAII